MRYAGSPPSGQVGGAGDTQRGGRRSGGSVRGRRAPPAPGRRWATEDQVMAFVQMIEFRTSEIDGVRRIDE